MRDASPGEYRPLLARDRALVTDRERGQNASGRRRTQHAHEAIAHRFARALDVIQWSTPVSQQPRLGSPAHVAGGADAALEKPGLVIEAMRVDESVRAAKAHRESPALAGMDRRAQHCGRLFLACGGPHRGPIPGEEHLSRHASTTFYVELEPHAALRDRRQAAHHADDGNVTSLELGR